MKRYKNHPLSLALFLLVNLAAVITAAVAFSDWIYPLARRTEFEPSGHLRMGVQR